jgi:hypothetical protein
VLVLSYFIYLILFRQWKERISVSLLKMAKKYPCPADLPRPDLTLKTALYDTLAPRLALLSQDVALAYARSVVLSMCHMAGVRRVRAVVAAADADGLVDLGAEAADLEHRLSVRAAQGFNSFSKLTAIHRGAR